MEGLDLDPDPDGSAVRLPGGGRLKLAVWGDVDAPDLRGQLSGLLASVESQGLDRDVLVLTPWMDAATGRRLHDHGVDYVDVEGNARISRPGVHVQVEGRRRAGARRGSGGTGRAAVHRALGALSTPAGLRVLFVLLEAPRLRTAPVRDVAAVALVSAGTAQSVLRTLREEGYLRPSADPTRTLVRRGELARLWVIGYRERLARTLDSRFVTPPDGVDALVDRLGRVDGVTMAGDAVTPGLRRGTALVVFGMPPWRDAITAGRLRASGEPTGVRLSERFWDEGLLRLGPVAPPTLLAAELIGSRDSRLREVAEEILVREADRD